MRQDLRGLDLGCWRLLQENVRAEGTAIVVVEQDVVQALAAASRVYCLQEGRVALSGAAKDLTREAITAAYFGA